MFFQHFFFCAFLTLSHALPILQDDMQLTINQLNYLKGNIKSRNALTWSQYYWPNSTLVYSIGKGISKFVGNNTKL